MIKHFMTDYLGILAYSDWLRDEGKEEEAIAFASAIAEERGWSDQKIVGRDGYGDGNGYGYSNGYVYGNGYGYGSDFGHGGGIGYGTGYGHGDGIGYGTDHSDNYGYDNDDYSY